MQDHVINEKAVAYIKIYYFSFSHYTGTCGGLCCGVKTTEPNSKKTFTEESLSANSHGSLIIKGHLQICKVT